MKSFTDSTDNNDYLFVGKITALCDDKPMITVNVNNQPVNFRIDTGADVTVIPELLLKNVSATLQKCRLTLIGPQSKLLAVLGKFSARMTIGDHVSTEEIFVVDGLTQPLLGWPAIKSLSILKIIQGLTENKFVKAYPTVFTGIGTMKCEYDIQLKENAKPFCLASPRRVALPLQNAVNDEIERMVDAGVVSPVTEPTDWCAGLVVVPKKDGGVRLCVDYTHLNKSILREKHMLPAVDETLAKLAGTTIFQN